MHIGSVFYF